MSEPFDYTSLKDLSDGDLALQLENTADLMENNVAFNEGNRSSCVPGPDALRSLAVEIKHIANAVRHDPSKEQERGSARERAVQSIKFSCQHLVMYSVHVNEPGLLDTIGVNRAQRTPRAGSLKIPRKLDKFSVSHAKKSGGVKIYVNSWEGKASVDTQVCYDDPAQESSWQPLKLSHYCHFTAEGLEPARRAYFRARLINDAGTGPWSNVVELIIL